jgi:hypothetical protein
MDSGTDSLTIRHCFKMRFVGHVQSLRQMQNLWKFKLHYYRAAQPLSQEGIGLL